MWISFVAILVCTSVSVFSIRIYISKFYDKVKKEMEELKKSTDNNNQEIYKINDKIRSLYKYRVAFRRTIYDTCYHGPSSDYSNEFFFDLESANDFVNSTKEWSVPVIIDLKNNMPIKDDYNMKNWDKYLSAKLR